VLLFGTEKVDHKPRLSFNVSLQCIILGYLVGESREGVRLDAQEHPSLGRQQMRGNLLRREVSDAEGGSGRRGQVRDQLARSKELGMNPAEDGHYSGLDTGGGAIVKGRLGPQVQANASEVRPFV